jgi:hypothetical protein
MRQSRDKEKTMEEKEVVKKIKSWRWRIAKAGMTQLAFCEVVSVTPPNMSMYLNGKKKPRPLTFETIESKLQELGV